jgi:hypothetical protein
LAMVQHALYASVNFRFEELVLGFEINKFHYGYSLCFCKSWPCSL